MRMQQHFTAIASLERARSLPVLLELRSCSSNRNIGYSKYLLSFYDISTSSSEKLSSTWIIWRTTASRRLPSCSASAVPVYVRRSLSNHLARRPGGFVKKGAGAAISPPPLGSAPRVSRATTLNFESLLSVLAALTAGCRPPAARSPTTPRIWSTLHTGNLCCNKSATSLTRPNPAAPRN